jgi:hypothetical protein
MTQPHYWSYYAPNGRLHATKPAAAHAQCGAPVVERWVRAEPFAAETFLQRAQERPEETCAGCTKTVRTAWELWLARDTHGPLLPPAIGAPVKINGSLYFTLDLTRDPYAMAAIREYAIQCRKTHPDLAAQLATILLDRSML